MYVDAEARVLWDSLVRVYGSVLKACLGPLTRLYSNTTYRQADKSVVNFNILIDILFANHERHINSLFGLKPNIIFNLTIRFLWWVSSEINYNIEVVDRVST